MFATCASVFSSEDVSSGLTAFQHAANDWEFVSFYSCTFHCTACWWHHRTDVEGVTSQNAGVCG